MPLFKDILSDEVFRPFLLEGATKRHIAQKIDTNDLENSDDDRKWQSTIFFRYVKGRRKRYIR